MPNVAGREFAYTPQGMAAAEQYKQSLGMRGGGMMGFRPVGYADGDLVESETLIAQNTSGGVPPGEPRLLEQFNIILESGSADQKRDFVTRHMDELLAASRGDPTLVQRIMEAINAGVSQRAVNEVREQQGLMPHNRGKLLAPPGPGGPVGRYEIYDDPDYPPSPVGTNEYNAMAGMGSSFPGPSFLPVEGQTAPDYSTLEEVFPQQRARGGYVGRGTSAGELAPRGSMSVREAGETMYELAKRRRGMRGGGIMSLRR